jgi:PleD family two-component response regulator
LLFLKSKDGLGVATLNPDKNNKAEQLLLHADRALYLAKEKGRNRVECYYNQ